MSTEKRWTIMNVDGGPLVVRMANGKPPWLIVGESINVAPVTEIERLREDFIALARIIEQNDHHATVRDARSIIRRVLADGSSP